MPEKRPVIKIYPSDRAVDWLKSETPEGEKWREYGADFLFDLLEKSAVGVVLTLDDGALVGAERLFPQFLSEVTDLAADFRRQAQVDRALEIPADVLREALDLGGETATARADARRVTSEKLLEIVRTGESAAPTVPDGSATEEVERVRAAGLRSLDAERVRAKFPDAAAGLDAASARIEAAEFDQRENDDDEGEGDA